MRTSFAGRKIGVLGLGASGVAAARSLLNAGAEVRVLHFLEDGVSEPRTMSDAATELSGLGVETGFGSDASDLLDWAELIVSSPGLAPSSPPLALAAEKGREVWSEVELAWQMLAPTARVFAVTGTNGKTTTASLLSAMLKKAGVSVAEAIHIPVVVAVKQDTRTVVCEVSSFHLAYCHDFRPSCAVVTNVADDHYDWHDGYPDYLKAKSRITVNQTASDLLVVSPADEGGSSIARESEASIGVFGSQSLEELSALARSQELIEISIAAGVEDDVIAISREGTHRTICSLSDIRLPGAPNLENVLAATTAAYEEVAPGEIKAVLQEFEGLPHRMTPIRTRGGVTYIDDSKATNPSATSRALLGLKDVILIAGGRSKGLDLSELSKHSDRLKSVVVMGEASAELSAVFSSLPVLNAHDVEDAVRQAAEVAEAGDVVLLSPACSSYDQYSGYAERGQRFEAAVSAL